MRLPSAGLLVVKPKIPLLIPSFLRKGLAREAASLPAKGDIISQAKGIKPIEIKPQSNSPVFIFSDRLINSHLWCIQESNIP